MPARGYYPAVPFARRAPSLGTPLGRPQGVLLRQYTFDSGVEGWTADSGTLTQTGGKLQLTGATNGVALEPSSVVNLADGEILWDTIPTAPNAVGWAFRATDTSNYYLLHTDGTTTWNFYKKTGGSFTLIRQFYAPPVSNSKLSVLVRMVGGDVSAYVNERLMVDFNDASFTTGRIGIFSNAGTVQADRVRVYTLNSLWTPYL